MTLKKSQKSLKDWGKQKWQTKSGKKSSKTGERYLPKKAIDDAGATTAALANQWTHYGTPDLHPEGYHIVSDLLVGVAADNCDSLGTTLEIDVMVIGEPVKLTEADMTEMLTQQQDL